ncbi:MAG: response regulator transcription factor [Ignavibacteria bacterium]|nr:response regulator transcription factor [Ignavibacteria bacterium]
MKHILIIEDDAAVAKGLQEALKGEHFSTTHANTGEKGLNRARHEAVDLIILDLILPDMNGEDICRKLRSDGIATPIMMLTSKAEEMDKVLGLEIGADDYVTKPFSIRELIARIKALLRRQSDLRTELEDFSFCDVNIDFRKLEATKGGKPIRLSVREFEVLKFLILHEGQLVTRDTLLNEVWGYEHFPTTRTVDNYILSLRKKMEDNPAEPKHFLTVPTAGYKLVVQ